MLINVELTRPVGDISTVLSALAEARGVKDRLPKKIGKGLYLCNHWNFELYLGGDRNWERYPEFAVGDEWFSAYGVCDSPDQFMEKYGKLLEDKPEWFVVSFVHIAKKDEDPQGGWRWHKWGPYIGNKEPTTEYLYDEPEIEEVYTYHAYRRKP